MAGGVAYLDSSAFVKLLVAEPESGALRGALARWQELASAALLRTEVVRALRRSGNCERIGDARRLMRSVSLVALDETLLDRAGDLDPAGLRSLDAVHLAAVLAISADVGVIYSYDERLCEAAGFLGFEVSSPAPQ